MFYLPCLHAPRPAVGAARPSFQVGSAAAGRVSHSAVLRPCWFSYCHNILLQLFAAFVVVEEFSRRVLSSPQPWDSVLEHKAKCPVR